MGAGSSLELPVERDDMKSCVESLTALQAKLESAGVWTATEREAVRDALERSRGVYAMLIDQAPAHHKELHKLRAELLTEFSRLYESVYENLVKTEAGFDDFNAQADRCASSAPQHKPRQTTQWLEQLYETGAVNACVPFASLLDAARGALEGADVQMAPLKKMTRTFEKAMLRADATRLGKVDGILDVVRGMVACGSMTDLGAALAFFSETDGWEIVRVKNRFTEPSSLGWADCLLNIVRSDDPQQHVCEVQLVHKSMFHVSREGGGHDAYRHYRTADEMLQVISPQILAFHVLTLNVGGFNTSSFEFEIKGDATSLGKRWTELYTRATASLGASGPRAVVGLDAAVDAAVAKVASEPRRKDGVVSRVLGAGTWNAAIDEATATCPNLFNASNLASLETGRPAPLEMPSNFIKRAGAADDNATDDADATASFLATWLAWLDASTADDHVIWDKGAKKYGVSLGDAVAGMLIFDTMCFEALKKAHFEDAAPESCGAVVRTHLAFHNRLTFATEAGKYGKVCELLTERKFPEVVCLQEAQDLIIAARGDTSGLGAGATVVVEQYHIRSADDITAVLVRKDAFDLDASDGDAESSPWYQNLERRGRELYGESPGLLKDWEVTLQRTCVCPARRLSGAGGRTEPVQSNTFVVIGSVHCRSKSDISVAFVPALAKAVSAAFPDAAAYVIGMDSNTTDSDAFGKALIDHGIMAEAAFDPDARTVAKCRTRLQAQLPKVGVLDVSLKDFLVAWTADGDALTPLIETTEQSPKLRAGEDVDILMPTADWPFDHALLVGEVRF